LAYEASYPESHIFFHLDKSAEAKLSKIEDKLAIFEDVKLVPLDVVFQHPIIDHGEL
jgi:hypothetical protein